MLCTCQVFFGPDSWPESAVPELQPIMQQCYSQCAGISAAVLRLFAASLGVHHDFFVDKTDRHHSNMQVRMQMWLLQEDLAAQPLAPGNAVLPFTPVDRLQTGLDS